jgi:septal ring-binding cell division protein DamX
LLTIGFGDLVPGLNGIGGNNIGAVPQVWLTFCSIYIMIGLAILGMAISIIGASMEKLADNLDGDTTEEERMKAAEEEMRLEREMASIEPNKEEAVDPYAQDAEEEIPPAIAS